MLSNLVGPVDVHAAMVLVAMMVCACVAFTSVVIAHRRRIDVNNQFELAKLKQDSDNARAMYVVETDRAYKFKQIEQNLITSHERTS